MSWNYPDTVYTYMSMLRIQLQAVVISDTGQIELD